VFFCNQNTTYILLKIRQELCDNTIYFFSISSIFNSGRLSSNIDIYFLNDLPDALTCLTCNLSVDKAGGQVQV
jgi:hypothetical protein